jgi:hypothetical protein
VLGSTASGRSPTSSASPREGATAELGSIALSQLAPAAYRSDAMTVLRHPAGKAVAPVIVQGAYPPVPRRAPALTASSRLPGRCATMLVGASSAVPEAPALAVVAARVRRDRARAARIARRVAALREPPPGPLAPRGIAAPGPAAGVSERRAGIEVRCSGNRDVPTARGEPSAQRDRFFEDRRRWSARLRDPAAQLAVATGSDSSSSGRCPGRLSGLRTF